MKHPIYATGDPKEGQPVLVGDAIWHEDIGYREVIAVRPNGAGDRLLIQLKDTPDGSSLFAIKGFLSRPPLKLKACRCGGAHTQVHSEHGWHIECFHCGRRSSGFAGTMEAKTAFDADLGAIRTMQQDPAEWVNTAEITVVTETASRPGVPTAYGPAMQFSHWKPAVALGGGRFAHAAVFVSR